MLSVLLPVKNGGEYFKAAIDSLTQQTFDNFECLVIDDNSTDTALSYLNSLNDNRFKVISNTGSGIVDALNIGLKHAQHSIIARMDADDIALPTRFDEQLKFLEVNRGIDFCGCKIEYFSDSKTIDQGLETYETWLNNLETHTQIEKNMFVECAIPHPSFMFRRSLIDKLDGYQDNGWPEDYDLILRAYIEGCRFG